MILEFQKVNSSHLPLLNRWLKDKHSRWRIGGMLPFDKFIKHIIKSKNRVALVALVNSQAMGFIGMEIYKNKTAALILLVNPEKQREGYGQKILKKFLRLPKIEKLHQIHAYIEPDNESALNCFLKAGFISTSSQPDKEGFLQLAYKR